MPGRIARFPSRARRCAAALAVCLFTSPGGSSLPAAEDVLAARAALHARYAGQLETLAKKCDAAGLVEQAALTRRWLPKRRAGRIYAFVLHEEEGFPHVGTDAPAAVKKWRDAFIHKRRAQGAELFKLAVQANQAGRVSLAYELLLEGAREDVENDKLRPLLGYELVDGRPVTSWAAGRLRKGEVPHEKFGWLPAEHVKKYEAAMRFYRRRWMPAAEEAALRQADINAGWRIETEHFSIKTNHSLEKGVELGRRLERLYALWQQVFVRYWANDKQIAELVTGRRPIRRPPRKHQVVHFRTRAEYNQFLRRVGQIGITLGIYDAGVRTAYFFDGEEQDPGTIYHEATHQLFQETRPVANNVGAQHNFWIYEGVACYMESLTAHDGYVTVGGLDAGRVPAARQRVLMDGFYVPLEELVKLGMKDLQTDRRIAKLYSQSSGLASFLIHYDAGRYRDALVDYLDRFYTRRDRPDTLAKLTRTGYGELDEQYRRYLQGEER